MSHQTKCPYCKKLNDIVNECGCDPQNMPTIIPLPPGCGGFLASDECFHEVCPVHYPIRIVEPVRGSLSDDGEKPRPHGLDIGNRPSTMTVLDSGKREEFPTGAVRDTQEGKGRYDLLPPRAIHLVARQFQEGAKKYGDNNWRRGIPIGRILDSGLRHAFKFMAGETDEDHLVAAAWNFLAAIEMRELVREGKLPEEIAQL